MATCRVPGPQICVFLCRLYENKGEADFVESLVQLFRSISDMMSGVSDQTVRVKVGPRGSVDHTQGPALRAWTPCRPGKAGSACPSKPGRERKVQSGFAETMVVVPVMGSFLLPLEGLFNAVLGLCFSARRGSQFPLWKDGEVDENDVFMSLVRVSQYLSRCGRLRL